MFNRSPVFLIVLALVLSATNLFAEELDAKHWLGVSMEHAKASLMEGDAEEKESSLYDAPELTYRLAIYYAVLKENELGVEALKALMGAAQMIIATEDAEDIWPRTYLPGPAMALGKDLELALPDDALNLPFTEQILAEAHFAMGDKAKYQASCDKVLAMLTACEDQGMKEAREYGYIYTGSFVAWHLMRMCRDNEDLTNARKFAGFAWHDDCERGGVKAMLAQMEFAAGNVETARGLIGEAAELLKKAVVRHHKERAKQDADTPTTNSGKWFTSLTWTLICLSCTPRCTSPPTRSRQRRWPRRSLCPTRHGRSPPTSTPRRCTAGRASKMKRVR